MSKADNIKRAKLLRKNKRERENKIQAISGFYHQP
jgi:hypothetical protein